MDIERIEVYKIEKNLFEKTAGGAQVQRLSTTQCLHAIAKDPDFVHVQQQQVEELRVTSSAPTSLPILYRNLSSSVHQYSHGTIEVCRDEHTPADFATLTAILKYQQSLPRPLEYKITAKKNREYSNESAEH